MCTASWPAHPGRGRRRLPNPIEDPMLESTCQASVPRDALPPTPPGPEGSNGNGLLRVQWVSGAWLKHRRQAAASGRGLRERLAWDLGLRDLLGVQGSVVAGFAAGRAIVKTVLTEADVNLALAEAAVPLADTLFLGGVAVHAKVFLAGSSAGAHNESLALGLGAAKMPEVTPGALSNAVADAYVRPGKALVGRSKKHATSPGARFGLGRIGRFHVVENSISIDSRTLEIHAS